MQLSEKLKRFCSIFIVFLEFTLNFEYFEKNEPPSLSISQVIDSERRARNPVLCISGFSAKFRFPQCFGHVIKVSAKITNNSRQRRFFRDEILDLIFENDLGENLDKTFDGEFE